MVPVGWFVVVVVLAVLGLYFRGVVGRLDRLHLRVEAALVALDVQLLRRSSLVRELGESGWLDPASSLLLVDAAGQAQRAAAGDRPRVEGELTRTLRAVIDQPDVIAHVGASDLGHDLLVELASSCERVLLARRFANDAIRAATVIHRRWIVRTLRLAGRAKVPDSFEMDDAPSAGLARFEATRP